MAGKQFTSTQIHHLEVCLSTGASGGRRLVKGSHAGGCPVTLSKLRLVFQQDARPNGRSSCYTFSAVVHRLNLWQLLLRSTPDSNFLSLHLWN